MIKKLARFVGQYNKNAILGPLFLLGEVLMDIFQPFVVASLIDKGIQAQNTAAIFRYGALMLGCALMSLFLGAMSGVHSSIATTGFAANVSDRYQFSAVFTTEAVLSLLFCALYLKVRERMAAPVGLGAFLTAAYLISYPITKGALNPAKAVALATFATAEAVSELRIFCTAPFAAALIAGLFARFLTKPVKRQTAENEPSTK